MKPINYIVLYAEDRRLARALLWLFALPLFIVALLLGIIDFCVVGRKSHAKE